MIPLNEWRPVSWLEVPRTECLRARFPVIDAHSHLKRPNDPAELGRQPYTARDFLIRYADRVVYGTDLLPNATNTSANYRFFETRDEYFPYNSLDEHNQGRWNIYGVSLPDETLSKIYYGNAERLLGEDS